MQAQVGELSFRCQVCNTDLRGKNEDELVQNVQTHARENHQIELSREQILQRTKK
jgi:predicted small metal-binding protein